jgi:hypothetical protein
VRGIKGEVDIFGIRARKLRNVAAVDRGGIHKEFTAEGSTNLPSMKLP